MNFLIAMTVLSSMSVFATQSQARRSVTPSESISIEQVDARATIAGCMAREAAARNSPQPMASDPKVRLAIQRQSQDPQRVEQCRRVLAED